MVESLKSDTPRLREALEKHGYRLFDAGLNLVAVHADDKTLPHIEAGRNSATWAEGT
jgi:hypothetical protein